MCITAARHEKIRKKNSQSYESSDISVRNVLDSIEQGTTPTFPRAGWNTEIEISARGDPQARFLDFRPLLPGEDLLMKIEENCMLANMPYYDYTRDHSILDNTKPPTADAKHSVKIECPTCFTFNINNSTNFCKQCSHPLGPISGQTQEEFEQACAQIVFNKQRLPTYRTKNSWFRGRRGQEGQDRDRCKKHVKKIEHEQKLVDEGGIEKMTLAPNRLFATNNGRPFATIAERYANDAQYRDNFRQIGWTEDDIEWVVWMGTREAKKETPQAR